MLLIEDGIKAWRKSIAALSGITFINAMDLPSPISTFPRSVLQVRLGKSTHSARVPFVLQELVGVQIKTEDEALGDVDRLVKTIVGTMRQRHAYFPVNGLVRVHWIDLDSISDSFDGGGLRQAVIAWAGTVSWDSRAVT